MHRPLIALFLAAACAGPAGPQGDRGETGTSCTVESPEAGVKRIVCTDGTSVEVHDGAPGENGSDSEPCSVSSIEGGALITCPDGSTAEVLDGVGGEAGDNGTSCTVVEDDNGKRVECEDGTIVALEDGAEGKATLVKLSEEAAGDNCALGGTKVEAGLDDDGSGALDETEVDSETYVCTPVPPPPPACEVFVGNIKIENSADLEVFARLGCPHVEGYLWIDGGFTDLSRLAFVREVDDFVSLHRPAGPNIELAGLERVGSLSVGSTRESLKTVSFPNLQRVSSEMVLTALPGLTTFSAPSLREVGGEFHILQAGGLTSLSGLSSLLFVGKLHIWQAESLTSLGLSSLRHAGNGVSISGNPALYQCFVDELLSRVSLKAGSSVVTSGNLEGCPDGGDLDGDGLTDASDNCPFVANTEQTDTDEDDSGDLCDARAPLAGELVLNELHVDPAGGDETNPDNALGDANGDGTRDTKQDEFVELVNASVSPLDLSGVELMTRNSSDESRPLEVRYTFPADTVLLPGRAAVIFGGGTAKGSFGGAFVAMATDTTNGVGLSNTADMVLLLKDDVMLNGVGYATSGQPINDESRQRSPEVTGSTFAAHRDVAGGAARWSPGTRADGSLF